MVQQYEIRPIATKEATNKFASIASLYLNEDIDLNKIVFQENSFNYKDKIKMKINEVHQIYDKKKEQELVKLKALINKKLEPVNGIISYFKGEYGNAQKIMNVYGFNEFLEKIGPKTLSDINSKLEQVDYFGKVNVTVAGSQNNYNEVIVTPVISEPLGSADGSFYSKAVEKLNPDEPGRGHDIGLAHIIEYQPYGNVFEKGF